MDDLTKHLTNPGFTPGRRHLDPLLDRLADEDEVASRVATALLRGGPEVVDVTLARLRRPDAPRPPARGRLVRLLGRLALRPGAPDLRPALSAWLDDGDLATRRQATIALGKLPGPGVEDALLARWTPDCPPALRRVLAEALGKVGGPRSRALLDQASGPEDPELRRLIDRARVMLARSEARPAVIERSAATPGLAASEGPGPVPGGLRLGVGSPGVVPVTLRCRRGLEELLLDEGRAVVGGLFVDGPGLLRGSFDGPLLALASLRVALSFGFPLTPVTVRPGDEARAIGKALGSPRARAMFAAWGQQPVRFRVAWRDGGHHRAVVWETARLALAAGLLNDPSQPDWELLVWVREGQLHSELSPRALGEVRFGYRQGDVPAASHPTVAAALARAGGAREDDIVWDPFVGSGLELCERSLLGPYAALHGSDRDPAALAVARANLAAAGAHDVTLVEAEARAHRVGGLTLVLTNPPLGHRVARQDDLAPLLDAVITSIAHQLRPTGRLVWLAPFADRAAHAGVSAGLGVERRGLVDLGGIEAELQVMRRPKLALPYGVRPR